jgi:hypothetical protein
MEGTLHAFALMAVIFGSAALCYRYGKRPEAVAPAFVFTLVGVLIVFSIFPIAIFNRTPPWDDESFLPSSCDSPAGCISTYAVFGLPSCEIPGDPAYSIRPPKCATI